MAYRFEHDPESGAFYIHVRDGEYHETIPLGEPGFGAGVDVDAEGNVLGFEFLSFEEFELVAAEGGGHIEIPDQLQPSDTHPAFGQERLREALDSLPQHHREVLMLFYFEALSRSEVADRLGVSIATAYQLQHAALEQLRVELGRGEPATVDDAELEAFLSTL